MSNRKMYIVYIHGISKQKTGYSNIFHKKVTELVNDILIFNEKPPIDFIQVEINWFKIADDFIKKHVKMNESLFLYEKLVHQQKNVLVKIWNFFNPAKNIAGWTKNKIINNLDPLIFQIFWYLSGDLNYSYQTYIGDNEIGNAEIHSADVRSFIIQTVHDQLRSEVGGKLDLDDEVIFITHSMGTLIGFELLHGLGFFNNISQTFPNMDWKTGKSIDFNELKEENLADPMAFRLKYGKRGFSPFKLRLLITMGSPLRFFLESHSTSQLADMVLVNREIDLFYKVRWVNMIAYNDFIARKIAFNFQLSFYNQLIFDRDVDVGRNFRSHISYWNPPKKLPKKITEGWPKKVLKGKLDPISLTAFEIITFLFNDITPIQKLENHMMYGR